MCVIYIADKNVRPTEEMLVLGHAKNPHGAGAAWREKGEVHYIKGMDLKDVIELNKWLPFPYVLHFRAPSAGTATGPYACHPFPVEKDATCAVKGVAKNGVIFHNGFWHSWKEKLVEAAIRGAWTLPGGPWTDSRGLAIMAHHVGPGYLEFINEKVIWFKKNDIEIFGEHGGINGWVEINDVICSNRHWENPASSGGRGQHAGFTEVRSTGTTEKTGGSSQDTTFRSENAGGKTTGQQGSSGEAEAEGNQQEEVQQGDEEALRQRMAEQSKGALTAPQPMCDDCKTAVARVHEHSSRPTINRCYDCWEKKQNSVGRSSGRAFIDAGHGKVVPVARCQFCWMRNAKHIVNRNRKVICVECWIKQDRPATSSLDMDDPRATIEHV